MNTTTNMKIGELSTRSQVRRSYDDLLKSVLGDAPYLFITVTISRQSMRRVLEKRRKSNGHLDSHTLPLLQELYNALRSGVPPIDAYETMWNKFFVRLQRKVLGSRFNRYDQRLRMDSCV